jgi:phospholipid/cholesterol/gamma-HCH transport system substrate-binding protein
MIMGVVLTIVLVIWLGVSNYLDKGLLYAAYFDESVQGLDKDSAVKYRGVTIGKVQDISVAPDGRLIEVILKIEHDPSLKRTPEKIIAQLKSVGITGLMFIELDTRKKDLPNLSPKLNFPSDYPVIATHPSDISVLFQSIDNVLATMGAVDLKQVFEKMAATLDTIDAAINHAQIDKLSQQLQAALEGVNKRLESKQWQAIMDASAQASERINDFGHNANLAVVRFDRTIAGLEKIVQKNAPTIDLAVAELHDSIAAFNKLINGGDLLVQRADQSVAGMNQELLSLLDGLHMTVEALNQFSERIAADPTQLLFGDPIAEKPTMQ